MPADAESALEARGDLPPHVVDGLPMPVVLTRRADDVVVRINRQYTATYGLNDEDASHCQELGRNAQGVQAPAEGRCLLFSKPLQQRCS